jgi:hypothetical protein
LPDTPQTRGDAGNPLIEVLVSIVAPALILMKLSEPRFLGVVPALLLALSPRWAWSARC